MGTAKTNFSAKFWMGSGPTGMTLLANRTNIAPPARMTRQALNKTDHDSPEGAEEFMPDGVYDPGEAVVTMHYIAGSADDDLINQAMMDESNWYYKWSQKGASADEHFTATGVITGYEFSDLGTSGKQMATLKIKISGVVDQGPAA